MTAGPSPAAEPRDAHEAGQMRRLDCANAGACLTTAMRNKWEAFRCGAGCYETPSVEQREQDHEGLTMLRLTIAGHDW